ncbi:MAG TPA: M20/M25/M40 family metallo-hydrolase [Allosphingosinicella sp.]
MYALIAGALLLLAAALGLKGQILALPDVPATAEASEFDTARALARLRRVIGPERPHPVDTEANDAVRDRLLAELRLLGMDAQVTDDFACNSHPKAPSVGCARVRNIVATMGPAGIGRRHIVAAAHYDGTPVGPGAADDGIGLAVLLETAHQLRNVRLTRPVTFLITDGEEAGLIGARAFLERHPLAREVEALVNFEARGVNGPAIMFETSHPNAAAIAAFEAPRPVSNSLTTDFYRLIPNATDVTVFEGQPWTILNFAVIGNETRYHSAGDTLAALDPRSVRHMGEQALATLTSLGGAGVPQRGGAVHYTDIAGRGLLVLPALLSFALLALALLVWAWRAWQRRRGLGRAVLIVVAGLVDAAALGWAAQFLIGLVRDGVWWRAHPEATGLAIGLSALAACIGPLLLLGRERTTETLRAAFWLVFLVLGALLALVAPGGTILFIFPPLIAAAGAGTRFERAAGLLAAALLFLLFAPLLELLETLLGVGSAWMFAPLAAIVVWPWLIELAPLFRAARARAVAAGVFALMAAGWLWAGLAPAYSEDRQQRFSVEYAWDADQRQGQWAILNDGAPLPEAYRSLAPWEASAGTVPWGTARRWKAPAPALPAPEPAAEMLGARQTANGRVVSLRIRTGGAETILLRAPPEADVRSVRAGGFVRPMGRGGREDPFFIRCQGRSCDGAVFDILIGGREPVEWLLIGSSASLPQAAAPLVAARPAFARPQYSPDSTISTRRLRF